MTATAAQAGVAAVLAAVAIGELLFDRGAPGRAWLRRAPLAALALLGRRLGRLSPPVDLRARLAAAGAPLHMQPRDLMALKLGAVAASFLVLVPLAAALPGRLGWLALAAAPLGAFLAPDLWLVRRARARGAAMQRELPDLLDLLRVAIGGGLSIDRALAEVGQRHGGALAREWRVAALEIELGVPRAAALEALRRRCPLDGVMALVAALERGARHGTPLAGTLLDQAADARAARARRIREEAARAAPKIQLVVALALVPSVLLLVAAGLLGSLTLRF